MAWFSVVKLVDYQPHSRIDRHAHKQASLSLIVGGRYREHIQGRGSNHEAGHMLYCPAHEEHAQAFADLGARQAQITPTADCLDFLGEAFDLSAASFRAGGHFSTLGRRMAAELRRDDRFSALAIEALALEAVTIFARSTVAQDQAPRWLAAVHDYVRTHSRQAFTVDDVARAVGRRPEDIEPAVRAHYRLTLAGLARRCRLEDAARMLAADEAEISAIALDCGFCDQAHLTRTFKAAYGVTPGAFRRTKALPSLRSIRP